MAPDSRESSRYPGPSAFIQVEKIGYPEDESVIGPFEALKTLHAPPDIDRAGTVILPAGDVIVRATFIIDVAGDVIVRATFIIDAASDVIVRATFIIDVAGDVIRRVENVIVTAKRERGAIFITPRSFFIQRPRSRGRRGRFYRFFAARSATLAGAGAFRTGLTFVTASELLSAFGAMSKPSGATDFTV